MFSINTINNFGYPIDSLMMIVWLVQIRDWFHFLIQFISEDLVSIDNMFQVIDQIRLLFGSFFCALIIDVLGTIVSAAIQTSQFLFPKCEI